MAHSPQRPNTPLFIVLLFWCFLTISAQAPNGTIDFESAVLLEVSIAQEIKQQNVSDPIPLPVNITEDSGLRAISRLASLFPALSQHDSEPTFEEALAEIVPPSTDAAQVDRRQSGLRVLAVGDSMTHCNDGDYTWRYRLWEWFQRENIAMTYVGPYSGTAQAAIPTPPLAPALYSDPPPKPGFNTNGRYAPGISSGFNGKHFAISGRSAAVDKDLIEGVLRNSTADLMLVMLGFNDLGWFFSDDDGLISNMKILIDNARRVNPSLKIVIGTVPHRTYIGGRNDLVTMTDAYNRKLKTQVGGWATSTSPVVWAPIREEYDCGPQYGTGDCPAAYDGLHPNEKGEYQIARAFSRALVSGLGIGKTALAVPANIPSRPLPVPANFRMASTIYGLTALWDQVYGAYEYDVDYVINGGAPFNFSPGQVKSTRWDTRWSQDGWTYDIRIRASAGNRKGQWTQVIRGTAKPETAAPPTNIAVRSLQSGISVTWDIPTGSYTDSISQYNIYYWDLDEPCSFLLVAGFQGRSANIFGLIPGHRYLVAMESWNRGGGGFPATARSVVVNRGTPAIPVNFRAEPIDAATVHLSWDPVPGAGGYLLARRSINEAGSRFTRDGLTPLDPNCADVGFQFPGVHTWEWAVTAHNGVAESGQSTSATPARYQEGRSAPLCPASKKVCSAGSGPPATDPVDTSNPPSSNPAQPSTGNGRFNFAVMGDSYASGVAYRKETEFDADANGCKRANFAYGPRLKNDFDSYFNFPACSGDIMVDMFQGRQQIVGAGMNNRAIFMQIGGNNAYFFFIAKWCLFGDPTAGSTGPTWPAYGNCAYWLAESAKTLRELWITDYKNTLRDVLGSEQGRSTQKFYVLGYARFFQTKQPESNYCDNRTLGWNWDPKQRQPLLHGLRVEINALVDKVNTNIQQVVREIGDPKVAYIDINSVFDGHRFCEAGQTDNSFGNYNNDIYFWAATTSRAWPLLPDGQPDPRQDEWDQKYRLAYFQTGARAESAAQDFDFTSIGAFRDANARGFVRYPDQTSSGPLGSVTPGPGTVLRTFHPTPEANAKLRDLLLYQLRFDFGTV